MRKASIVVALGLGTLPALAAGQDTDAPDLEFLEYLGSWQEADDEWEIVAEWDEPEDTAEPRGREARRREAAPDSSRGPAEESNDDD